MTEEVEVQGDKAIFRVTRGGVRGDAILYRHSEFISESCLAYSDDAKLVRP